MLNFGHSNYCRFVWGDEKYAKKNVARTLYEFKSNHFHCLTGEIVIISGHRNTHCFVGSWILSAVLFLHIPARFFTRHALPFSDINMLVFVYNIRIGGHYETWYGYLISRCIYAYNFWLWLSDNRNRPFALLLHHDTSTYDNMQHIWTTETNSSRQFALLFGQMPQIKTDVYLNYHCLCVSVCNFWTGNDNIRNYFVHLQLMACTVFMLSPTIADLLLLFAVIFRKNLFACDWNFRIGYPIPGVLNPFLLLKYVISVDSNSM